MSTSTRLKSDPAITGDLTSTPADRDSDSAIPLEGVNVLESKDVHLNAGNAEQDEEFKDVVPNGGYGWVNVGCVVLQNSVTWGKSVSCSVI